MTSTPAPDGATLVKEALRGFVSDLQTFQNDIQGKLHKQEERLTMLQHKTISRPVLSGETAEAPHQKAFEAYIRTGDDDALRGLDLEGKAMGTSVAADGGYLVDPVTSDTIASTLKGAASLRAIATIAQVEASSYDVLVDHGDMGSAWATEAAVSETTTPKVDRISIPLHELSALPKASQRLLDDAAFDIEAWLAARIADKFGRAEAAAFVSGDGIDKPKGFLSHTVVADGTEQWGELGYVATGEDGDVTADAILDVTYALGAQYRANGTFVMNSKTAGLVRKLKDADGRFLWTDMTAGQPATLMGYPVLIAEDMPDAATGAYAVAFGDFAAGYTVAERPDLRILRDPFSAKPHVLFYATKRVGGDVTDFEAIKLLKFATS
ncbi:MAG: phage major capsid protein [Shimia sp.]